MLVFNRLGVLWLYVLVVRRLCLTTIGNIALFFVETEQSPRLKEGASGGYIWYVNAAGHCIPWSIHVSIGRNIAQSLVFGRP
jgi:hypothetical protein